MTKQAISPLPVRGMRDFLPSELKTRNHVLSLIRKTVLDLGFTEIETPCVEDIAKLTSKQGGENESMIFEIARRGLDEDKTYALSDIIDSGLRYDLTVPLSRYYAHNLNQLPAVLRAFQTGPVWRAERPQKGRYRQFNQCDIDILGAEGMAVELEILSVGATVLQKLGLADKAVLHLNDRRLLDALMDAVLIAPKLRARTLIELDKLDKVPAEKIAETLVAKLGVGAETADLLLGALAELRESDLTQDVEAASIYVKTLDREIPLFDLKALITKLAILAPQLKVKFDPSLIRGMGYYTGPIYEVKHADFGSSICGGGRYDHMIGKWLGKEVPAVGFSFGFERLISLVDTATLKANGLALGYKTEEDHQKALTFRARYLAAHGAGDGYLSSEQVGLVHLPNKLKQSFFDQLLETGYNRLIMPRDFDLEIEDALKFAKVLQQ